LGEFCTDVRRRKKGLNESSGTGGGYLIPRQFMLGIDSELKEVSLFHREAFQVPMETEMVDIPSFDVTASHALGSTAIFGGGNLAWLADGQTIPETDPSFAGGQLTTRSLKGLFTVSDQLVEDGGAAFAAYLEQGIVRMTHFAVERACFQGSGTNQPLGIIKADACAKVTRQNTGLAPTQADLALMVGSLFPACFARACWACHPTTLGAPGTTAGLATLSSYVVNMIPGETPGLCGYIMGRPLFVTEKLPTVGNLGDVVLFDPALYVLGTRYLTISISRFTNFAKRQHIVRLVWRGDGQPLPRGTLLLADNQTISGCFVALN
jgi:HK97 family phage major capsid protein